MYEVFVNRHKLTVFITFFLVLGFVACRHNYKKFSGQKGDWAPNFSLKDLRGNKVKLSNFRGKYVILNFWATWCPPCVDEMPSYQKLAVEHPEVIILAINFDEDEQTVRKFVDEKHLTFAVLLDKGGKVKDSYGVDGFPETFMINPDGKLVKKILGGPIDWQGHGPDPDDKLMLDKFLRGEL